MIFLCLAVLKWDIPIISSVLQNVLNMRMKMFKNIIKATRCLSFLITVDRGKVDLKL